MTLTVETSTRAFSVALFEPREIACVALRSGLAHSQHIVSVVSFILDKLDLSIQTIEEAFAGTGPGSFTGIRIGLSFVNTLSQILRIPLLGVSSLDLLAFQEGRWYNSAIPFIKSRKNEVYTAFYREGRRESDLLALSGEELIMFIEQKEPDCIVASKEDFHDVLGNTGKGIEERVSFALPDARALYHIARECGLKAEHTYLKPIYLGGV